MFNITNVTNPSFVSKLLNACKESQKTKATAYITNKKGKVILSVNCVTRKINGGVGFEVLDNNGVSIRKVLGNAFIMNATMQSKYQSVSHFVSYRLLFPYQIAKG